MTDGLGPFSSIDHHNYKQKFSDGTGVNPFTDDVIRHMSLSSAQQGNVQGERPGFSSDNPKTYVNFVSVDTPASIKTTFVKEQYSHYKMVPSTPFHKEEIPAGYAPHPSMMLDTDMNYYHPRNNPAAARDPPNWVLI